MRLCILLEDKYSYEMYLSGKNDYEEDWVENTDYSFIHNHTDYISLNIEVDKNIQWHYYIKHPELFKVQLIDLESGNILSDKIELCDLYNELKDDEHSEILDNGELVVNIQETSFKIQEIMLMGYKELNKSIHFTL